MSRLDDLVGNFEQRLGRGREMHHVVLHLVEAVLDALGDFDFALARQQLDRAHLAHVHAHRVGRATELGVNAGESRFGFLGGIVIGGGGIGQE